MGWKGGNNLYVYSAAKPLMDFDSTGLFASGRWVKEPYISDIRVPRLIGFDFVSPYMDWFCYLNMVRLHWLISGSVSFEVECIDKCEKWNINGNIFIQKQTHGDLGPNLCALAAGVATKNPKVGLLVNVAMMVARIGTGLNKAYDKYHEKAELVRSIILSVWCGLYLQQRVVVA